MVRRKSGAVELDALFMFIPLLTICIGFNIHPSGDGGSFSSGHHQVGASANLYFTGSTYPHQTCISPRNKGSIAGHMKRTIGQEALSMAFILAGR